MWCNDGASCYDTPFCAFNGNQLREALTLQVNCFSKFARYNEFVIDAPTVTASMPGSIEAFFYLKGDQRAMALAQKARMAFLKEFANKQADGTQVPLLEFDPAATVNPFADVTSILAGQDDTLLGFEKATLYCVQFVYADAVASVEAQFWKQEGIFACDGATVVTDIGVPLQGPHRLEIRVGQQQGWGDAEWIFVQMWDAVRLDGSYRWYEWTVKVDFGTAFVAARFRAHIISEARRVRMKNPDTDRVLPVLGLDFGRGVWIPSCKLQGLSVWRQTWWDFVPYMVAISRAGLETYFAHADECEAIKESGLRKGWAADFTEWFVQHARRTFYLDAWFVADEGCTADFQL